MYESQMGLSFRYINYSLPTRKNLSKWGISSNSECTFGLSPESLLHVVAGCQSYLERFTWRHNSVLDFLARLTLQSVHGYNLFADLPGFRSPSVITGDSFRPDLLLACSNNSILYFVELTVGYESNLVSNIKRKRNKFQELMKEQRKHIGSSNRQYSLNNTRLDIGIVFYCHKLLCANAIRSKYWYKLYGIIS